MSLVDLASDGDQVLPPYQAPYWLAERAMLMSYSRPLHGPSNFGRRSGSATSDLPTPATLTMPSDDYAPIGGGGALRIKGAKVNKKKKKRDRTDLEKNLEAGDGAVVKKTKKSPEPDDKKDEEEEDDTVPAVKTESERRHEEIKKQRVRAEFFFLPSICFTDSSSF